MGKPFLPYGRQSVNEEDVRRVEETLRSDYLTTGPAVESFENAVARVTGVGHGVAVSNGTAALHCVMYALGVGPGDEVVVPPMTFAATANSVLYQGGTPVFADVREDTLCLDPKQVAGLIGPRTKAVVAVDYAGQPADYDELRELTRGKGVALVADACHSLGGSYKGRPVGSLADATVFSFHPVKPITTGEGGMAVTDDADLAARMRRLRNHGMDVDYRLREASGSWEYDIVDLGWNYRLTDIQSALGLSQLGRLPAMAAARQGLAEEYGRLLGEAVPEVVPLAVLADRTSSWHLYVVRVDFQGLGLDKNEVFRRLRDAGIGVNVHYRPVHLHTLYRERLGTARGMCPVAERAYEEMLTLPLHASMEPEDVARVVRELRDALGRGAS